LVFQKFLIVVLIIETDIAIYICYSICENLPYGRTSSVILDQLYSHMCDCIYG